MFTLQNHTSLPILLAEVQGIYWLGAYEEDQITYGRHRGYKVYYRETHDPPPLPPQESKRKTTLNVHIHFKMQPNFRIVKNVRWRKWENVSKLKKYNVLQIRVENANCFLRGNTFLKTATLFKP